MDSIISNPRLTILQWDASGRISGDPQDIQYVEINPESNADLFCFVIQFMHLFPETLWNAIVEESNKYRVQNVWGSRIKEIKREELMKFVGLLCNGRIV